MKQFVANKVSNQNSFYLNLQKKFFDHKMEDNVEVYDKGSGDRNDVDLCLPEGCGLPVAEGGGLLSPLSGAYLLIVLSEPMSDQHKSKMIQKLRQGKQFIQNHHVILIVL